MLAVLAAFFCLLFFAAAKKSRCRPAQGRRLKHEGKTRMPAKRQKNQNDLRRKHRLADASEKPKLPPSVADNKEPLPQSPNQNPRNVHRPNPCSIKNLMPTTS